jgi:hypothetical protein
MKRKSIENWRQRSERSISEKLRRRASAEEEEEAESWRKIMVAKINEEKWQ